MLQMLATCILFLAIGLLGLTVALQLAQYGMNRAVSIRKIFIDLKPKLWMTAWLGLFFACFYLCVVLLATYLLDEEMRHKLFSLARDHPTNFIYGGLALFAFISLTIIAVRSVIKRLYNLRHRG